MFILPIDIYAKPDGTLSTKAEDGSLFVVAGAAIEDTEAQSLGILDLLEQRRKEVAQTVEHANSLIGRLEAIKEAHADKGATEGETTGEGER